MLFYLAKIHNLLCFCFAFVVFYIVFGSSTDMCEPTSTVFPQRLRGVVVVQDVKERMSFASLLVRLAQRLSTTATLFVVFWRLFLSFKAPSPAFSRTRCSAWCLLHLPKNKLVFGEFHYLIHARSRCGRLRTAHGMV